MAPAAADSINQIAPAPLLTSVRNLLALLACLCTALPAAAEIEPIELHHVIDLSAAGEQKLVALTLDACEGKVDAALLDFLIEKRIPSTIFVTRKWLKRNPDAALLLIEHQDLFEVEDHGAAHVPAVIDADRRIYGLRVNPDATHLRREVEGGAEAIKAVLHQTPSWYRGATGEYDAESIKVIESLGYKIAGFSVNADQGGTLSQRTIVKRLDAVKSGDIIIAHINRPTSQTSAGLAAGLPHLLERGFRFVRLDEVRLVPTK
jgi:peptidoglycan/xylan/chitin deacetylase (PgdA/CDA1 family)